MRVSRNCLIVILLKLAENSHSLADWWCSTLDPLREPVWATVCTVLIVVVVAATLLVVTTRKRRVIFIIVKFLLHSRFIYEVVTRWWCRQLNFYVINHIAVYGVLMSNDSSIVRMWSSHESNRHGLTSSRHSKYPRNNWKPIFYETDSATYTVDGGCRDPVQTIPVVGADATRHLRPLLET